MIVQVRAVRLMEAKCGRKKEQMKAVAARVAVSEILNKLTSRSIVFSEKD
jgi:hypothetical protein